MDIKNVELALEALKSGKIILVMDDESRENEGDLICSAEAATKENVNFMACYAKGLICMPMSEEIAAKLAKDLGINCYENRILTLASQITTKLLLQFPLITFLPQPEFLLRKEG